MEPCRLLIVDDEEHVRESLRRYFEDEGFCAEAVESGEMGLDWLERESADVAVVDMRLSGMDGQAFILEACRRCPGMAFVIYTGSSDYTVPESLTAHGLGPESVFRKPLYDLGVLLAAVRKAAGKER